MERRRERRVRGGRRRVSLAGRGDPVLPAAAGPGLWIAYQSVNHVSTERGRDGFTVRLTAGNPG